MQEDGRALVDAVRAAAERHGLTWTALIPDRFTVNAAAEASEEAAYAEMAQAKQALRDHISKTYGISIDELASLATP